MYPMVDHLIDLKALLMERPDCDAGAVRRLRNALARGGTRYRPSKDVTELFEKKTDSRTSRTAKNMACGLVSPPSFVGRTAKAVEHFVRPERPYQTST
jgi:hypothetical protein